jgi:environmental stress-induced protein Ves
VIVTPLASAGRHPVAWKNGGGVTTEIAAAPPGASLEDFDWRVSLATIAADGPFSIFPDVDRTLVMHEGGVRLAVAGRDPIDLTPASAPLTFPGDAAITAKLATPAASVLNVMVRRGQWRAQVKRLEVSGETGPRMMDHHTLLFVAAGQVSLAESGLTLEALDAAHVRHGAGQKLTLRSPSATVAHLVALFPL